MHLQKTPENHKLQQKKKLFYKKFEFYIKFLFIYFGTIYNRERCSRNKIFTYGGKESEIKKSLNT